MRAVARVLRGKKWIGWAVRGFRPDGCGAREMVEHKKYEIFKLNRKQGMVIKSSFEDSKIWKWLSWQGKQELP